MSNPVNGRRVAFPDAYPGRQFNVLDGEAGIYVETTGGRMQINHDATPWHYLDVDSRLCEQAGAHQLATRHPRSECPAEAAATELVADETWDREEPDEVAEIVGHIRREDGTVAAFRIARTGPGYGYSQWGTPALGRNVSVLETICNQLNGDFE